MFKNVFSKKHKTKQSCNIVFYGKVFSIILSFSIKSFLSSFFHLEFLTKKPKVGNRKESHIADMNQIKIKNQV